MGRCAVRSNDPARRRVGRGPVRVVRVRRRELLCVVLRRLDVASRKAQGLDELGVLRAAERLLRAMRSYDAAAARKRAAS